MIDTATAAVTCTNSLAPYPGAQVGSNPDALALSADGHTLYAANAGNNDVAVIDLPRMSEVHMSIERRCTAHEPQERPDVGAG